MKFDPKSCEVEVIEVKKTESDFGVPIEKAVFAIGYTMFNKDESRGSIELNKWTDNGWRRITWVDRNTEGIPPVTGGGSWKKTHLAMRDKVEHIAKRFSSDCYISGHAF